MAIALAYQQAFLAEDLLANIRVQDSKHIQPPIYAQSVMSTFVAIVKAPIRFCTPSISHVLYLNRGVNQ